MKKIVTLMLVLTGLTLNPVKAADGGVAIVDLDEVANQLGVLDYIGVTLDNMKIDLDNELKKMPGYRGGNPVLASYTYLAEPKTADKEDLIDMEEPHLINGLEDFSEVEMAAFLQAMKPSGETG